MKRGGIVAKKLKEKSKAMEAYDLFEERNHIVVKSNKVIQQSRYSLSLGEQKLLTHLIQRIKPDVKEFDFMEFTVSDYCRLMGYTVSGKNYHDIKADLKALADKSFWLPNDDGKDVLVRWFDKLRTTEAKGTFEVKFDNDLKEHLLNLKGLFVKYNFYYVMTMKSQYSIRIYELLKSYANWGGIEITITELRERLLVDKNGEVEKNKYKLYADFKRRVIEQAVVEINSLTDLIVSYSEVKKGRSVVALRFKIKAKSDIENLNVFQEVESRLAKKV